MKIIRLVCLAFSIRQGAAQQDIIFDSATLEGTQPEQTHGIIRRQGQDSGSMVASSLIEYSSDGNQEEHKPKPGTSQRRRTAVMLGPTGELRMLRREGLASLNDEDLSVQHGAYTKHSHNAVMQFKNSTGLLIEAIADQQNSVEDLQARIQDLELANHQLEQRLQSTRPLNLLELIADYIQPGGDKKKLTKDDKKKLKDTFDSKYMKIMFVFFFTAMIIFELQHLTKLTKVDFSKVVETEEESAYDVSPLEYTKSSFLFGCAFPPDMRPRATAIGVALFAMNIIFLYIQYKMNDFTGKFWDMMVARDWQLFVAMMEFWFFIGANWMIVGIYMSYLNSMLLLDARTSLTFYMTKLWMGHGAFHHIQLERSAIKDGSTKAHNASLDNPDQRIQDDCDGVTGSTLDIVTGFLTSLGRFFIFVPVLWRLSPKKAFGTEVEVDGWLLYTSMLYALICACAVHIISKGMITINFLNQMVEADFRSSLVRVRDNAESIAMMNAEEAERRRLETSFESVQRITWEYMFINKRLGAVMSFLNQIGGFFPYFLLAPSYFAGHVTLGVFFQTKGALDHVQGSLTWFSDAYGGICDWRAVVNRLYAFHTGLEEAALRGDDRLIPPGEEDGQKPKVPKDAANQDLEISEMTLLHPDGSPILSDLSLTIEQGSWVLLTGPEGSGKTTLLRALAGIWPYVEPKELIGVCPGVLEAAKDESENAVFFLPQRASCLREGTLRDAVAYPLKASQFSDSELNSALFAAGLSLGNSLDDRGDWVRLLSGGESQRLNLSHAILRQPKWLFLDEPCASLPAEVRGSIYAALREHLPKGTTVVSVDHDVAASKPYHDVHYAVDPLSRTLVRKS